MFRPLSSQNSDAANYGQLNDMIRSLNKEQQTKTFRGPNQINALTTGKLKDLGYGLLFRDSSDVPRIAAYIDENNNPILKVSKSGFDATTTGDANLIFNSSQNVFKIVAEGTGTFAAATATVGGGGGWSEDYQQNQVSHNLGYIPVILAFVEFSSHRVPCPLGHTQTDAGGAAFLHLDVFVDSTTIRFGTDVIRNGTGSSSFGPYNCKYYLLQETAN